MTYFRTITVNGCGPYLYEYKSVRQPDGRVKGVFVAYHGRVYADTVAAVERDMQQRGSDVELANRLYDNSKSFVVLDTETTGLSNDDEPWEFCGLLAHWRGRRLVIEKQFNERARPSRRLSPDVERLCGVKDSELDGLPPVSDVYSRFRRFVGSRIQAGHNVAFDQRMMNNYALRHGHAPLAEDRVDTMVLSRRIHPKAERHDLSSCVERDGVRVDGQFHSAIADTRAVAALLEQYTLKIKAIAD